MVNMTVSVCDTRSANKAAQVKPSGERCRCCARRGGNRESEHASRGGDQRSKRGRDARLLVLVVDDDVLDATAVFFRTKKVSLLLGTNTDSHELVIKKLTRCHGDETEPKPGSDLVAAFKCQPSNAPLLS